MSLRTILLSGVLLVGLALVPGCVDGPVTDDEPAADGDGDDDERTYESCDALTIPFEENGTAWEAARVECDANVAGANEQTLSCPVPGEARLRAAANLTSGELVVAVDDDAGDRVAEHRLQDTGGQTRELTVDGGAGGEWTLATERLEGYEGTFQAELACPQE